MRHSTYQHLPKIIVVPISTNNMLSQFLSVLAIKSLTFALTKQVSRTYDLSPFPFIKYVIFTLGFASRLRS